MSTHVNTWLTCTGLLRKTENFILWLWANEKKNRGTVSSISWVCTLWRLVCMFVYYKPSWATGTKAMCQEPRISLHTCASTAVLPTLKPTHKLRVTNTTIQKILETTYYVFLCVVFNFPYFLCRPHRKLFQFHFQFIFSHKFNWNHKIINICFLLNF